MTADAGVFLHTVSSGVTSLCFAQNCYVYTSLVFEHVAFPTGNLDDIICVKNTDENTQETKTMAGGWCPERKHAPSISTLRTTEHQYIVSTYPTKPSPHQRQLSTIQNLFSHHQSGYLSKAPVFPQEGLLLRGFCRLNATISFSDRRLNPRTFDAGGFLGCAEVQDIKRPKASKSI